MLHCVTPFHASMNFGRVSLVLATSLLTSAYFSKSSSTTCIVKVVSFSSLSCDDFFTMPCATTNDPMTVSDLSYRGTNLYTRVSCSSLSCFILLYDYMFSKMASMHSNGGNVFIFSMAFCTLSYAFLNLSSMAFIARSSVNFV
jgi:hypothetical protein